MEDLEGDVQFVLDVRELGMEECLYFSCLKKIGEFLDQVLVIREEVVFELGNGIVVFELVFIVIYCFLCCMELDFEIFFVFNSF